ncbi:cytochrome o ubiquinol oxidase subunit III [Pseudochelatococcus contaminans]|uniref:Cytochrome bo(3) ubiquinol oxidase subunit 3 n=1 Tax=Pseudochelatococcus contaminans TaxID=1538103 RepID=A0A7W5Z4M4_9HYPH|nr:cytochrome o ubiquinol oxidase subunit III [Pseudochelatococcus contaminans]MBB3809642.1 cytochrome o ubiquinol oxidase subunit 3 [Pseudochelatococcus contaminans]
MTKVSSTSGLAGEAPVFFLTETDEDHGHHETGTNLGFWIYLMSDCLIFASLFAVHAVVGRNYAGGPAPVDLFDLNIILLSTTALLISSITYGFSVIAMQSGKQQGTLGWLAATGVFGLIFLGLSLYEFYHLIHIGATPQVSAFLSSFFALVGTHALHVAFGIVWLVVLLVQIKQRGLIEANQRRVLCLSMFWHFLDLVWIVVFSFVYLIGVL